jgi:DNA-binding response OmpR family regulator
MAELGKTVLMTQIDDEQGRLWQSALLSQGLEVFWEASDTDLVELLKSMKSNNLVMPDLLLMDMGIKSPNSETLQAGLVCQWCTKNQPKLKVVLFNPRQDRIKEVERGWAIRRGAVDVLPKLYQGNLVATVKLVVDTVRSPFSEDALQSVVLTAPQNVVEFTTEIQLRNPEITPEPSVSAPPQKANETARRPSGLIYRGVKVKNNNG